MAVSANEGSTERANESAAFNDQFENGHTFSDLAMYPVYPGIMSPDIML